MLSAVVLFPAYLMAVAVGIISTLGLGSYRVQPSVGRPVTHWCPVTHCCPVTHRCHSFCVQGRMPGCRRPPPAPLSRGHPPPAAPPACPTATCACPSSSHKHCPVLRRGRRHQPPPHLPQVCVAVHCSPYICDSVSPPAFDGCVVARWRCRWAWTIRHLHLHFC